MSTSRGQGAALPQAPSPVYHKPPRAQTPPTVFGKRHPQAPPHGCLSKPPSCHLHCCEPARVVRQTRRAWGQESLVIWGLISLTGALYSFHPDSDPFGTAKPPHKYSMVFGLLCGDCCCDTLFASAGHTVLSETRDNNLMLLQAAFPSQLKEASAPLRPGLNGSEL